ncbi:hypothetical protein [Fluviicola taffensis]|uniref:hypothetical protein n=1 Tax=Fluviicola taffensis TaxID=191579 RepID=UPI0031381227
MTKGNVHYLALYFNGEIKLIEDLHKEHCLNIVLLLKRTFESKTGGKGHYSYFKTEIINPNIHIDPISELIVGKVKVKIIRDQYWGEVRIGYAHKSMIIDFELTDLLDRNDIFKINFSNELTGFNELTQTVETINRVGTIQGTKEIQAMKKHITLLEEKITHFNQQIRTIKE